MQIANIHEAKSHLSNLIDRALAGEDVVIARAGQPVVRLEPIRPELQPRRGGQMKGRIWVSDDFDAFDPDIERLFLGEGG